MQAGASALEPPGWSPGCQEDQEGQKKPEAQRSVPYSFTRAEALRTASLYILVVDKMIATTVGVSCGSFLLLTMQENNAVDVSIATHVMIPCARPAAIFAFLRSA